VYPDLSGGLIPGISYNLHLGTEFQTEAIGRRDYIRVRRWLSWSAGAVAYPPCPAFGFANGPALVSHGCSHFGHIRQPDTGSQQGASVAGSQFSLRHQQLDSGRQLEESERVRHCTAFLPESLRKLLLGKGQDNDKSLISLSFFNGIEILPLYVFRQSKLEHPVVRDVADDNRHLEQASALRGDEPSLPSHQLVAAFVPAHQYGLQDAVGANGGRKLLKALLLQLQAWLIGVWGYLIDVDFSCGRGTDFGFRNQRPQPSAQHLFFHG